MTTLLHRPLLEELLTAHPPEKMLFLAGPRQAGKTFIAKKALEQNGGFGLYLNWDIPKDRKTILAHHKNDILSDLRKPGQLPLVVFDEIHKMNKFKGWLKGFYDQNKDDAKIWVTGSGRLDLYQKGGDSLLGRYFLYHMHPLTVGELSLSAGSMYGEDPDALWQRFENGDANKTSIEQLLKFGGFPEPFLKQTEKFLRRWHDSRRSRVTHEDVRDLTRIQDLDKLEYLIELLNPRISSPFSLNSVREDLEVNHDTVKNWMKTLQRVYYVYTLKPYSQRIQRSLKKEEKVYYWDWSEVLGEGARFENFAVSHFKKACDRWTDFGFGKFQLWYVRDKAKNEVDVLITRDKKPWLMAEIKLASSELSPALVKFGRQLKCPRIVQIVASPGVHRRIKIDDCIVHLVSAGNLFGFIE